MVAAKQTEPLIADPERRFLLVEVPWWSYVAIRDGVEHAGVRMTYLEGRLELMRPSETHDEETKLIARLVETWADELDIDLRGFRSTTYRDEATQRGLEADECYSVGPKKPKAVPQIAIEVIVSSPLLDKLDVYAGLGVAEVWVWHSSTRRLIVHRLMVDRYTTHERSALLPQLDLAVLCSFIRPGESHTALAKAYRAALRGAR
jgi:Uma2 family endonuclease